MISFWFHAPPPPHKAKKTCDCAMENGLVMKLGRYISPS